MIYREKETLETLKKTNFLKRKNNLRAISVECERLRGRSIIQEKLRAGSGVVKKSLTGTGRKGGEGKPWLPSKTLYISITSLSHEKEK